LAGSQTDLDILLRQARAAIEIGNNGAALMLLHRAESLAPMPAGWRAIGDVWHAVGNHAAGANAHLRAARASGRDPELVAAAEALAKDALPVAEATLQARLQAQPTDIAAMRLMAELEARRGNLPEAAALLERALDLAPDYKAAQDDLAHVQRRQIDSG
jgi:tetratricopeptide (TPR) repeat protein